MSLVGRDELFADLDAKLEIGRFKDYAPNGVQIDGAEQIEKVALAVSFSLELVKQAADWGANAIVVHHGTFWKNEPRTLRGYRKARIQALFDANITLAGYHLPLDAHMELGNNVGIASALGLTEIEPFGESGGRTIGVRARTPKPWSAADALAQISTALGAEPVAFMGGRNTIETVGIISGGAGMMVGQAIDAGLDLFLTGEPTEPAMATATEAGIHFVAGGHYRTETFGVKLVGGYLREKFGVATRFFEIPNPV